MARTDTLGNFLTDVADAIRTKKGTTDTIQASEFDTEIVNLSSGGKYAPRYISFRDYTGTELTEELAELDTSNITNMNYMFQACYKLISLDVSNFNTSNVTNMYQMFNSCSKIASLDLSNFDTSNVTIMANMFTSCSNLTSLNLDGFDTSKVTNMRYMFQQCKAITDLPELSAESVTNIDSMFLSCNGLTNFGGLKDLGKAYLTTQSANSAGYRLMLTSSTLLTHDSLMNIINNLYDIKTKGCNTQALTLGATNLAKLTEEEIAIATNKGWTVS